MAAVQIAILVPFNIYGAWMMYQGAADEKIRYDGFAVGKGYAPSFLCRPVRHDPSVPLSPLIRRTDSNFTQPYPLLPCCPAGLVSPYACLLSCLPHAAAARHAARQCAVRDDVVVCRLTLTSPSLPTKHQSYYLLSLSAVFLSFHCAKGRS